MSFEEGDIEHLVTESLRISVVKKNIFDISVEMLREKKVGVKVSALMDTINGLPIREFGDLLTHNDDKEKYADKLEEIVTAVLSQYLRETLEQKR